MNRYVVEKWEGRRSGVDHALWRKAELRCRGGQGQAGMGSLFCHLRPWWLLPPAVAKAMFGSVALPVTAVGLMSVSCYYQRLCGCLGWEQLPEAMLVSKGHADAVAIHIWMACTIIQGDSNIQAWAVAKDHIQVHGPMAVGVCVDVHG